MKQIIAEHTQSLFLKPGEVIVSTGSLLVSTVLGSCIAVTLHVPEKSIGAICHAMLPRSPKRDDNPLFVDTAIRRIYREIKIIAGGDRLVVKLFGGARVLPGCTYTETRLTVGEQNALQAHATIEELGLQVASADIGGQCGRRLFFSIKNGDVFLRRFSSNQLDAPPEVLL